jgi:hypothetical protein
MTDDLDLQEIRVLRLRPGDTLTLITRTPDVSRETLAMLKAQMDDRFPGHETVVINNADLAVIRAPEQPLTDALTAARVHDSHEDGEPR